MKKRNLVMVLAAALTLTACSGNDGETQAAADQNTAANDVAEESAETGTSAASGETITLRLSNNQPDGNCTTIAVEWFADQVRERTDGRINIEVYNNGTLGDAVSCMEQAQYGGMDIVKADCLPYQISWMIIMH